MKKGGAPSKRATAYLAPAKEVKEQKPKRAGAVLPAAGGGMRTVAMGPACTIS